MFRLKFYFLENQPYLLFYPPVREGSELLIHYTLGSKLTLRTFGKHAQDHSSQCEVVEVQVLYASLLIQTPSNLPGPAGPGNPALELYSFDMKLWMPCNHIERGIYC